MCLVVCVCVCLAGAESEANADKIITGLEPNKEESEKVKAFPLFLPNHSTQGGDQGKTRHS